MSLSLGNLLFAAGSKGESSSFPLLCGKNTNIQKVAFFLSSQKGISKVKDFCIESESKRKRGEGKPYKFQYFRLVGEQEKKGKGWDIIAFLFFVSFSNPVMQPLEYSTVDMEKETPIFRVKLLINCFDTYRKCYDNGERSLTYVQ